MANMLDYLLWRGDIPLDVAPFNAADNLIMAELSYVPLELCLRDTVGESGGALGDVSLHRENDAALMAMLAESRRFASMPIMMYEHELDEAEEKQFAAVSVALGDGTVYVSYRGTDNTMVGWKEDFNMSFQPVVPSQSAAADYLERVAAKYRGGLRVGGHSKGGNLAVFAASHCSSATRARIVQVYNNDGPGQSEQAMDHPGYREIEERIETFVPQSSVVGMLLAHSERYRVVLSDGVGLLQHDPFTWQMTRSGFVYEGGTRRGSQYVDATLAKWLDSMSMEDRQTFTDTIFSVLSASEAKTLSDLTADWRKNTAAILTAVGNLDPEKRKRMLRIFKMLMSAGAQSLMEAKTAQPRPDDAPARQ